MKKSLLFLTAVALGAGMLSAGTPAIYNDYQFTGIAPNGNLAGSFLYGDATIMNPRTGEIYNNYTQSEDAAIYYSEGLGNSVSNTGILLGSSFNISNAAYWKQGNWVTLYAPNPHFNNMTNGITADGLTICGSIGMTPMSLEETATPMMVPAVWELKEDGTYGSVVRLPYPEKDFTGRVPQYVTAISISDDGNTIAGQVHDYSGFMDYPITYTRNEFGDWEYSDEAGIKLVNPKNLKFPEWPGEMPAQPNLSDFMDPEEIEAWNSDYIDWANNGYEGDAPELEDYATDEEKAAYQAAMDKWNAAYAIWLPKFEAFSEVFNELYDDPDQKAFEFNSVALTPDGKTYIGTCISSIPNPDPFGWFPFIEVRSILTIDVADGQVTTYPMNNMSVTGVATDGTILGVITDGTYGTKRAAMYLAGSTEVTYLDEYVKTKNQNLYNWMKENMNFDVEVERYDPDTDEVITETVNMWLTGVPRAAGDLSLFLTTAENVLGLDDYMYSTYGYVLPMDYTGGIQGVAVDTDTELPVEYYTIDGLRVNDLTVPGIYIKRQGRNTSKVIVK